jgi:hypothetical protein
MNSARPLRFKLLACPPSTIIIHTPPLVYLDYGCRLWSLFFRFPILVLIFLFLYLEYRRNYLLNFFFIHFPSFIAMPK